jgi:hypothetical protein
MGLGKSREERLLDVNIKTRITLVHIRSQINEVERINKDNVSKAKDAIRKNDMDTATAVCENIGSMSVLRRSLARMSAHVVNMQQEARIQYSTDQMVNLMKDMTDISKTMEASSTRDLKKRIDEFNKGRNTMKERSTLIDDAMSTGNSQFDVKDILHQLMEEVGLEQASAAPDISRAKIRIDTDAESDAQIERRLNVLMSHSSSSADTNEDKKETDGGSENKGV